jgi:predicted nucleic acid-binding protein
MKAVFYVVDTGPLVAWFNRKDPAHALVRAGWAPLIGRFVTTGAVITEALVTVDDTFAQNRLDAAVGLMARHHDIPMDFADATLVLLAERLVTPNILTLDERGFRTFRFAARRRFQLVLQDG